MNEPSTEPDSAEVQHSIDTLRLDAARQVESAEQLRPFVAEVVQENQQREAARRQAGGT